MSGLLQITAEIKDIHESGEFATRHNKGEFENDRQRWDEATERWRHEAKSDLATDCINLDNVKHDTWKIYIASCMTSNWM